MMSKELTRDIKKLSKGRKYDCMLMFSGGKDSSYLLYFLSQELGLKVATITLRHDFLARETIENIESFAKKYSAKHFSIENHDLNHAGNHFLNTWINKPDEGSLITLCTGCRMGLVKTVIDTAKREDIKVVITGLTPFEATDYRTKLVHYPKGKDGSLFFLLGYLRLILRNPSLIADFKALKIQAQEFYYHSQRKKLYVRKGIHMLVPFYDYLEYDEARIIQTLGNLQWQKAAVSTTSFWRADCNMNAIRQFFHQWISGYNELEKYYGEMLDQGLINEEYFKKNVENSYRKEDILRILRESKISKKSLEKYEKFLADGEAASS